MLAVWRDVFALGVLLVWPHCVYAISDLKQELQETNKQLAPELDDLTLPDATMGRSVPGGDSTHLNNFQTSAASFWSSSDIFVWDIGHVADTQWTGFAGLMRMEWGILFIVVVLLLLLDFFLVQPLVRDESLGRHTLALLFWVFMGVLYNLGVAAQVGPEAAWMWCAGYLLEWLLSLDNLFVFHLVFKVCRTPRGMLHKALFIGILGAALLRMCFFTVLSSLLSLARWTRFIFGAFLIYSGLQAALDNSDETNVCDTFLVRALSKCLGDRLYPDYDAQGARLFIKDPSGKWQATMLVPVIVSLEVADIIFAVDSVTAKVAQIPDYYVACSSSVLAIWGLRSMFFILRDLVDYFDKLKYGLCFILLFIGVELLAADYINLPPHVVCAVVCLVFLVSVLASVMTQGKGGMHRLELDQECEMRRPPLVEQQQGIL